MSVSTSQKLLRSRTLLLSSAVATGILVLALNPTNGTAVAESKAQHSDVTSTAIGHPGFADMIQSVRAAVVNISTTTSAGQQQWPDSRTPEQFQGHEFDEFMKRFFGAPGSRQSPPDANPRGRERRSLGSGFIVDPQGYVVTNRHVVEGADEITVTLDDGTELNATLRGLDDKTDLAVLEVNSDEALPWVAFNSSDSTRVGDWVIAIGNPFGLGGTATTGIVSARGRDINSGPLDDYIQIDAPINRGNSGGPLFNADGEVIGINTAIFSPNGGSVGIGFAIPADQAQMVVTSLKDQGFVSRGYLGVHIQQLTEELSEALGLENEQGALISQVAADSPAQQAGLLSGDVILQFGDEVIEEMRELPHVVSRHKQEPVEVRIFRNGEMMTLDVTPKVNRADDKIATSDEESRSRDTNPTSVLGLAAAPIDDGIRQQSGLQADEGGVVVADVQRDGPSARQGIRPGDIITAVGTQSIATIDDLREQLSRVIDSDRQAIVLKIVRQGSARFVAIPVA